MRATAMPTASEHSPGSGDVALVSAARGGDGDAWAALVQRYQGRLAVTVRALTGAEPWEDVVQEVWMQAYRDLDKLRTDEAFWPWLLQIAKRTVYRTTRCRRREQAWDAIESALPTSVSAEAVLELQAESHRVWQAYDLLKGRDRDLIRYRFIDGGSPTEVAALLQLSIDSVYTATQRARASFALALERAALALPFVPVSLVRRWRRLAHGCPEAVAAVMAGVVLVAAPALTDLPRAGTDATWHASPVAARESGSRVEAPARLSVSSTAPPTESPHQAAGWLTVTGEPTDGGLEVEHQEVLRLDPAGRRLTTYDGDFSDHDEPDVHIGNDDTVAVRLWPYEQLPIDRPEDAPVVVVGATGPNLAPPG